MNQQSRNLSDLIILLLLPAPLLGIVLILASLYVITDPDVLDGGGEDEAAEVVVPPTSTVSAQAIALATVNAAPALPAPSVNSAAAQEVAAASGYTPEMISTGERTFSSTCSACHGMDARGIQGLGKTLINSEFVRSLDDAGLVQFIIAGRPIWDPLNTTGVEMPARGGNPMLAESDIANVVAYIRTIDGHAGGAATASTGTATEATTAPETAATPETTTTTETGSTEFVPLDVTGLLNTAGVSAPDTYSAGIVLFTPLDVNGLLNSLGVVLPDPVSQPVFTGEQLYQNRCMVCHGENGEGVENMGANLQESEAIQNQDSEMLMMMIHNGSPIWSENNESGHHMPASGGYPLMSDEEINRLIEYLYTLAGE